MSEENNVFKCGHAVNERLGRGKSRLRRIAALLTINCFTCHMKNADEGYLGTNPDWKQEHLVNQRGLWAARFRYIMK